MKLNVDGMSCGGCVSSVKRILARELGTDESDIDVRLDEAAATIPDDADDAKVQAAVSRLADAGFPTKVAG